MMTIKSNASQDLTQHRPDKFNEVKPVDSAETEDHTRDRVFTHFDDEDGFNSIEEMETFLAYLERKDEELSAGDSTNINLK